MTGTIKVIIVDDHKLFREGIISILSDHEDISIIGEATCREELMALLKEKKPNVLLIDISLPQENGLEIIKELKDKRSNIKSIVLTMHEEGQYVVKAVRSGAYGYLLKNTDEQELMEAITTVFSGKKYFNQQISELMIGNMAIEGESNKKLSKRESEVLALVSEGKTTKEIATELSVSTRTVETHRMNLLKKLNVQNTAELIKKATTLQLI